MVEQARRQLRCSLQLRSLVVLASGWALRPQRGL
jgi:hypothetical protein